MRRLSLVALICTSLLSPSIYAAAFQFYELGTPVIGTAGVGQAVLASDASTAYFNPAGMTLLSTSEFMLGSQVMTPYINFSKSTRTTILGDNGGNAGSIAPGIDLYYVYRFSPALNAGVSLTSPFGGSLAYNNGWVGRFIVQDMMFYTFNLNPSLAYRFNEYISAGLGVAVEYANLHETVALPLAISPLVDGQSNLKVDNYSAGYNLALMFTPRETTKIGFAFRSRINHHLNGDVTFLRIPDVPNASTRMVMPQNFIASISQTFSNVTLLGEIGWANWSVMKNTIVHIASYSATIPRDWNNTYRFGLGGQYQATPAFLLQAGASYDSSPTTSSHRTPDLPMDRQIRLGAGIIYSIIKEANLGFSYEYFNGGHANINNQSANGMLSGFYSRNYANVFQASINVNC